MCFFFSQDKEKQTNQKQHSGESQTKCRLIIFETDRFSYSVYS